MAEQKAYDSFKQLVSLVRRLKTFQIHLICNKPGSAASTGSNHAYNIRNQHRNGYLIPWYRMHSMISMKIKLNFLSISQNRLEYNKPICLTSSGSKVGQFWKRFRQSATVSSRIWYLIFAYKQTTCIQTKLEKF